MRKIVLLALIGCSFSAFAKTSQLTGFYLSAGLGAGWSDADQDHFTEVTSTPEGAVTTFGVSNAIEVGGVAANVALGYAFPYFCMESKFTHVPDYTENDTGQLSLGGNFAGFLNSNAKSSLNYFSFLGVFKVPIYHFHLIAGSGLAIVLKRTDQRKSTVSFNGAVIETSKQPSENSTFYQPEIVAGISKDMTKHWTCQVAYTRVFGKSHIGVIDAAKHFLPNINTLTFVVSYTL